MKIHRHFAVYCFLNGFVIMVKWLMVPWTNIMKCEGPAGDLPRREHMLPYTRTEAKEHLQEGNKQLSNTVMSFLLSPHLYLSAFIWRVAELLGKGRPPGAADSCRPPASVITLVEKRMEGRKRQKKCEAQLHHFYIILQVLSVLC